MQRDIKEKIIFDGEKFKIAIVASSFHDDITARMAEGAVQALRESGVRDKNIKVIWVPGSFELPLACQKVALSKKFDGIIAIGCVIKGETDHHYHIANECSRGIMKVMLGHSIPIGFGVITTNSLEQALSRSYGENNKGKEAAEAVLEMLSKF